ncbi:hypothetical protein GSI_00135 [Ganoderma sinense ZZ0214-1]|uniref:Uncharacterized protein n=1 Tax=Ganoderma sinense ZZ0214-1 TaxID=1077348 RepID=A0A2G8SRP9_9APHY|nr:hypothetical protein GSI_00135 [Ganoderma sinense ZZ0214-1]
MENAWSTRGSERYLYTVYSHIISHLCDTILPPQFPTSTVSHTPQAIFKVLHPPLGEAAENVDKEDPHPEQIPDFVRMIFTYTESNTNKTTVSRRLIDLWEIKGLNITERWDGALARLKALEAISKYIEQLWKQARAAFAHNETWTVVYALLIVGPYFSQVVWERPPGVVEPPTPDLSNSTITRSKALLDNYNARIEEAKARDVPRVEFLNAPVFDFEDVEEGQAQKVSLSPHFLYALSLPLKEQFDDCDIQPS